MGSDLTGKKIACFIMLPHHTRFLLPVAREIRRAGGRVIFFLSLSDFPFERNLMMEGEEFCFITDYMTPEIRSKMDETFRKIADDWLDSVFDWHGFSFWSLKKQDWTMEQIVEEYYCIERFIEVERPDMFMALHERNRWGKIIGYHSHRHRIPYITFQEGDYYAGRLSFNAHAEYSTLDLLWGRETREVLVKNGCPEDKMILVGNTHLDEAVRLYNSPGMRKKVRKDIDVAEDARMALFLVDLSWCVVINEGFWRGFLKGLSKVTPVFKWHPNVNYSTYTGIRDTFKAISKDIKIVLDYNSYALVGACDVCIVLGATTLALESLAFGKPLFALPQFLETKSKYVEMGVARATTPGKWEGLDSRTYEPNIETVEYLNRAFYANDGNSVRRAVEVMGFVLNVKRDGIWAAAGDGTQGRVSFIIPSGDDIKALLATLKTLSDNVRLTDWEVVIVVNSPDMAGVVNDLSGDISTVELYSINLAELYNAGAKISKGERLVFIRPGIAVIRCDGLTDTDGCITGGRINNTDNSIYTRGFRFDFNSAPRPITDEDREPQALGGGVIAIEREVFEKIGGFAEDTANHLIEIDLCLRASVYGIGQRLAQDALFYNYREMFYHIDITDEGWKRTAVFYARWMGHMPKDEDYISYAGEGLKIQAKA